MFKVLNKQTFASNSATHTDVPLSDIAFTRMGENDEHISDILLPDRFVNRGSDKYYKGDNSHFKLPNTDRASQADPTQVDFNYLSGTYFCTQKALAHFIPDELIQDADELIARNYETDATEYLTWMLRQDKERRTHALLFNSAVITNNVTLSGTAMFSDYDNSNPLVLFRQKFRAMHLAGGRMPNKVVIQPEVWDVIAEHPLVINRASGYQRETTGISPQIFSKILASMGFPNIDIIVPMSVYNTAGEGASDSFSYIWSNQYILFAFVDPTALNSTMKKTLGVTWRPNYLSGTYVKKYRLPNKEGTFIEVNTKYDIDVTNAEMGYLILGAI